MWAKVIQGTGKITSDLTHGLPRINESDLAPIATTRWWNFGLDDIAAKDAATILVMGDVFGVKPPKAFSSGRSYGERCASAGSTRPRSH